LLLANSRLERGGHMSMMDYELRIANRELTTRNSKALTALGRAGY